MIASLRKHCECAVGGEHLLKGARTVGSDVVAVKAVCECVEEREKGKQVRRASTVNEGRNHTIVPSALCCS